MEGVEYRFCGSLGSLSPIQANMVISLPLIWMLFQNCGISVVVLWFFQCSRYIYLWSWNSTCISLVGLWF